MKQDKPVAKGDAKSPIGRERERERDDEQRNPLGAHPVGEAVGAATGAVAAGAAVGSMAGPAGAAVGAVIGGVVGAWAGKGIADSADPRLEDEYWRENWKDQDYIDRGFTFEDYGPAYRYGVDAYSRYPDRHYDDIESDLSAGWDEARGESRLGWDRARHATRDAWQRVKDAVERAIPGDSDKDGK